MAWWRERWGPCSHVATSPGTGPGRSSAAAPSLVTAPAAKASLKSDAGGELTVPRFWLQFGVKAEHQRMFAVT